MDRQQVEKTALLARLKLSESEVVKFTDQLTGLLDYVAILNEIDTDDVEPMAHAVEVSNVLRDDEPVASLARDDALSNAPKTDGVYFLVPPILTEG
ncbi:MAG: Asp-tRNA(Asn)/Glu-tRNA(Gln) amidotransferase subunit GatC [Planctomycetaceae bacterium]|jgi:aspartyl-tRNA(Asn)/glutamyl-tRNA(Gln) amidotransferase subunit C|nr:Asp-tRNA(Asn)/Glu-tRNA(Gln) amidotransferase subunit GatC [Planctomycetaceae bacterium]MBT6154417.1 Asp-tRNA(Asn)/Glu-tRNA(Gln) amidotransferase subunit GatC [Planctomycetaceae bacterium]MBT6484052.1 Asp-tRNA(Asn)/Glu-tRNA(Gln) amidotransferase subunit GatC [Planctomycetaceae bacterium]MBT6496851.1 Asp-tRNA(Asn)/Glu-tRNA(Gln) amidotransferase subunit GatC [Planctomycetaceae bacterium]